MKGDLRSSNMASSDPLSIEKERPTPTLSKARLSLVFSFCLLRRQLVSWMRGAVACGHTSSQASGGHFTYLMRPDEPVPSGHASVAFYTLRLG